MLCYCSYKTLKSTFFIYYCDHRNVNLINSKSIINSNIIQVLKLATGFHTVSACSSARNSKSIHISALTISTEKHIATAPSKG